MFFVTNDITTSIPIKVIGRAASFCMSLRNLVLGFLFSLQLNAGVKGPRMLVGNGWIPVLVSRNNLNAGFYTNLFSTVTQILG